LKKALRKKPTHNDNLKRHFLSDFFFSDDEGLAVWKKINTLPDYYQTDREGELLERHGNEIVEFIWGGSAIIDLGWGKIDTGWIKRECYTLTLSRDARKVKATACLTVWRLPERACNITRSTCQRKPLRITWSSSTQNTRIWNAFSYGVCSKTAWNCLKPVGARIFLSLGWIFGNGRFERAVKSLSAWTVALGPA
jgi:hypothetical protein